MADYRPAEPIEKEDYAEPACLLCEPSAPAIDVRRLYFTLDDYRKKGDAEGAKRLLEYWLTESRSIGDKRGELVCLDELTGVYRRAGLKDAAFETVAAALPLIDACGLTDTLSHATVVLNCGTVMNAFEEPEKALAYYRQALAIFLKPELNTDPERLAGLYNNMAAAETALSDWKNAADDYEKALDYLSHVPDAAPRRALTLLNMAAMTARRLGPLASEDAVAEYCDRAESALGEAPDLPATADIREDLLKCAEGFGYFGRFAAAAAIRKKYD